MSVKSDSRSPLPERDRTSGVVLAVGAVASMAMMSHHPSIHAHGTEAMFAEAVRLAFATRFVHGALIAATVAMVFGFTGFARALGLARPLARLGLVTYALGGLALVGAALLNGLVFPDVAEAYSERSVEEMRRAEVVFTWNWAINQALTLVGVLAWSAATLAWSLLIVRLAGAWRWIGAVGIVVALASAATFLSGALTFDVRGFGLYLFAQSLWSLAVGVRLLARP